MRKSIQFFLSLIAATLISSELRAQSLIDSGHGFVLWTELPSVKPIMRVIDPEPENFYIYPSHSREYGEPIILFPGASGTTRGWYDQMIPALDNHPVVLANLSGQGVIGEIGVAKYDREGDLGLLLQHMEEMREIIADVYQLYGRKKVVVVGHSYSALILHMLILGYKAPNGSDKLTRFDKSGRDFAKMVKLAVPVGASTAPSKELESISRFVADIYESFSQNHPTGSRLFERVAGTLFRAAYAFSYRYNVPPIPTIARKITVEFQRQLGLLDDIENLYSSEMEQSLLEYLLQSGFSSPMPIFKISKATDKLRFTHNSFVPALYVAGSKEKLVDLPALRNWVAKATETSEMPVGLIEYEDMGHIAPIHHPVGAERTVGHIKAALTAIDSGRRDEHFKTIRAKHKVKLPTTRKASKRRSTKLCEGSLEGSGI